MSADAPQRTAPALLSVDDLRIELAAGTAANAPAVAPVDGASLRVDRGEIVGLVGESGSGKSLTSLAVMGLLPQPGGRVARGSIALDGKELVGLPADAHRRLRGRRMAMIFQDPMSSLNPYLRLAPQLTEAPRLHLGLSKAEAVERAVALLSRVGLPDARARLRSYPHELSGGMRQRVMIAMALLCEPELLIADEPTTALDVTIQAQILELLAELRAERGTAVLLITHDLGVVGTLCDRVAVMYAGEIVEEAPAEPLFSEPRHPYTRALLQCTPSIDRRAAALHGIPGRPPLPVFDAPAACRFAARCGHVRDACRRTAVAFARDARGHGRRCVVPVADL